MTATEQQISDFIVAEVERRRAAGTELESASSEVMALVRSQRPLLRAFLDEFGVSLVRDVWRNANKTHRNHELGRPTVRRVPALMALSREGVLEALYEIDGEWLRLGDLRKGQPMRLAQGYRRRSDSMRAMAEAFESLDARLEDGEAVRAVWTDEQIKALFQTRTEDE